MLLTISTFRDRVLSDMTALIHELQAVTKRKTPQEAEAWRTSLPRVASAFAHQAFDELDVYFGTKGMVSLEYNLPASSSWADMVLLGRHGSNPAAVVIELKNWHTRGDTPGHTSGLMYRQGRPDTHPSSQVAGYAEYIKRFHSAVQSDDAAVHGCVMFTRESNYRTYELAPNAELTSEYPCFSTQKSSDIDRLLEFFQSRLTRPDRDFAERFEEGAYVQSRGFVAQIGAQVLDTTASPFVLLDNQRLAFAVVNEAVQASIVGKKRPKKTVVIVKGPPGSGKSVVAAKVWASLVTNVELSDGNVVVTTTSTAQRSNWEHLFSTVGGSAAKGVTVSANTYTPATTGTFGVLRRDYPDAFKKEEEWRSNVEMLEGLLGEFRTGSRDNEYLVSIVDEAHALINPEHVAGRGQFGFATAFGPQAYHIMRASVLTVFLLDEQQGFRDRENTSIDDIKQWAAELKVAKVLEVDLSGSQFRCEGSVEYIRWVDELFDIESSVDPQPHVNRAAEPPALYNVRIDTNENAFAPFVMNIFDDVVAMERVLRQHQQSGHTVRLLASYSRPWKTKGAAQPHTLNGQDMDFHIRTMNGEWWSKVWNYTPQGDYSLYVQARIGYPMYDDPLCEVGCPYTVRGFDFDYVGLLWMSDLVIRDGKWVVNPEHVFESGLTRTLGRVKRAGNHQGEDYLILLKCVQQYYRILMTRAIKGLYIWCEDEETREWLRQRSQQSTQQ